MRSLATTHTSLRRAMIALASVGTILASATESREPSREEDIEFWNGKIILAGMLVLPDTGSRYPAVVLVHGSGAESRREYLTYAREFAGGGIAVLAFEKRGAGRPTRASSREAFYTHEADVLAAVDLIKLACPPLLTGSAVEDRARAA